MPLDPDTILNRPGMSLRQYAAIQLKVPNSGIPELDAMIRQARREEMVGRALQGLLATGIWTVNECASNAEAAADAAIKAMVAAAANGRLSHE